MAHVKNAGGGPGDEDLRPPPRLPTDVNGKAMKKLATKKRKYADADTEREQQSQPPQSVQREEVLGVESRSQITFHQHRGQLLSRLRAVMVVQQELSCLRDDVLFWRRLSLRGESQQQTEQIEETEQAPQLRRSSRTHTQVTPRAET